MRRWLIDRGGREGGVCQGGSEKRPGVIRQHSLTTLIVPPSTSRVANVGPMVQVLTCTLLFFRLKNVHF